MDEQVGSKIVKGSPIKIFFLSMLTRDVSILDAIGDLIDNAVDGARTLAINDNYQGRKIDIIISEKVFSIEDNCGGIDIDVARNYAFRFGRSPKYQGSDFSIGQFGIGMKRSLFKLSKAFEIHSTSSSSWFKLKVDIDEWASKGEDDWDFEFNTFGEKVEMPENDRGTKITITKLNEDVKNEFKDSKFIQKLILEIERENIYPIYKGLKIKVNGSLLRERDLTFLTSEELKIGYEEHNFKKESGNISVKIYAGISEEELDYGGWYVFCNGRMLWGPEQTAKTGWTGRDSDGGPKYHLQYARFRGYVFFEASNPSLLPWNTAKNAIDEDSPIFKNIRQRMIFMMKPVINFLNSLKAEREKDAPKSEWLLQKKIDEGEVRSIKAHDTTITPYTNKIFIAPSIVKLPKPSDNTLQVKYRKEKSKVDKVKKYFDINDIEKIGSLTFDYFYNREIDD